LAILDSIGKANHLAISDPLTDTLHLFPRDIIIATTNLHGTMTVAEVGALRQPLKKKLSAMSDLPSPTSQLLGEPLPGLQQLARFLLSLMRSVCSSPPSFPSSSSTSTLCCLLWHKGKRNRRLIEASAAYIIPQLHNILAHSNPRPFAGNLEEFGEGASEDGVMGGDLIYPPKTNLQYPTANSMQPYYPQHHHTLNNSYHHSPGLGFPPYPYPMANGFYPYTSPPVPAPAPSPAPSDKKDFRQQGKKQGKKGQNQPKEKTGTPNINLPRTYLMHPFKLHFYCHFHGWVITHGWPSGHGSYHGDP
jgi:hypothetical protein